MARSGRSHVGAWTLPGDSDDVLHEEADNRLRLADVLRLVHDRLHHVDVLRLVQEEMCVFFILPFVFASTSNSLGGSRSKPGLATANNT